MNRAALIIGTALLVPLAVMAQQDDWKDVYIRGGTVDTSSSTNSEVRLVNANGNDLEVDTVTRALITVTYEHHEKHAGSAYHVGIDDTDLDSGETNGFVVVVADSTKWPHVALFAENTVAAVGQVWRGATIATNGTEIVSYNDNHNSTNTALTKVYQLSDSTISSYGTKIDDHLFGSLGAGPFGGGGSGAARTETIWKQNTAYVVLVIGQADNGRMNLDLNWYEHTSKTD